MKSNAKKLIKYTKSLLRKNVFHQKHRTSKRYFTRESPLGFKNTATIILNSVKKSIKAEVMNYFYKQNKEAKVPSRQAFSQAREKISYQAFKEFFEKSCELTIESEEARVWRRYRVFGIDGTSFMVGEFDKLKEYFGESTAVDGIAMCRLSAVVDILNECIANASVAPFGTGERVLAIEQIEQLKSISNALYLFDRGYWSPELVSAIIRNGQKFLMRLASNTGKTKVTDESGNEYALRRYSFVLPSGEVEVLLTNLSQDEVSNDELAALYAKRWGAETKYLELKDRLQIDKFSGESVNVVLQDIYSTLYISNLVAFTCWEADEAITERNKGKENKYEQKANRTICISTLRTRFIDICLLTRVSLVDKALEKLLADIESEVVYINKSKPRPRNKAKIKHSRGVYHNKSPL